MCFIFDMATWHHVPAGKTQRLKQAKADAEAEIKAYQGACDDQYKAKEAQVSDASQAAHYITYVTSPITHRAHSTMALLTMLLSASPPTRTRRSRRSTATSRPTRRRCAGVRARARVSPAQVIKTLLSISMQVEPRVHQNYRRA